jgi:hypothetical protein
MRVHIQTLINWRERDSIAQQQEGSSAPVTIGYLSGYINSKTTITFQKQHCLIDVSAALINFMSSEHGKSKDKDDSRSHKQKPHYPNNHFGHRV